MNPEVSIIIRTKDREIFLTRALESIIYQTFKDWFVIIVNNGGNQHKVEEVVEYFKPKLCNQYIVYHTDRPYKMEVATNIGIKLSKGKYIAILDDDDTWSPEFLEKCIQFLKANKNFSGVVTQTTIVYEEMQYNKIKEISRKPFNNNLKKVSYSKLLTKNLYTTNAFLYLRSAIDDVGYYNEDYPVLGDWDFNIRFAYKKRIGVIQENLAFYHKRILNLGNNEAYQNSGLRTHIYYDYCIRKKYLFEAFHNKNMYIFIIILINLIIRQFKLRIKLIVSR